MMRGRAISVAVLCCLLTCCERTPPAPITRPELADWVDLTPALDDQSAEVREAAAEVLSILGPRVPAACDKLRDVVRDDPVESVRQAARIALDKIEGSEGTWGMAAIYVGLALLVGVLLLIGFRKLRNARPSSEQV